MANPLPPLRNADILYGRSLSINHLIHQLLAENLNKWREPKSPKEIINFVFLPYRMLKTRKMTMTRKRIKIKTRKKMEKMEKVELVTCFHYS